MIKGNLYLPGRARVPIPKKSVEEGDKLGGKVMLSVDFETGEKIWDEEMENALKTKLDLNKDDFLKAIKNNRTQAGAIKELGISVGSFYKYKKIWEKEAEEMKNTFTEILDSVDAGAATKPEPEEIHEPTMTEVESFFEESATFNPEEPTKVKGGRRVNVLQAVDIMNEAREESYSVTCIFDQVVGITPAVRQLLENHKNESEMIIDNIGNKLGQITVRL